MCAPREGGGDPKLPYNKGSNEQVLPAKAGVIPNMSWQDAFMLRAPREGGGDPAV